MSIFKMAWRNLWRNRRRSVVTLAAMSLALFVMICYSGIIQGYLRSLERNVVEFEIGDLQIFAEGYRNKPSLYAHIDDFAAIDERLTASGYAASGRLLGAGLAAGRETSAGAFLRGIDVAQDATVSKINQHLARGSWLAADDPHGVVVGKGLAKNLGLAPGSELVILSQGADGSMANELYTVRGVLRTLSTGVDRGGIFLTQQAFRELLVLPSGVHQILVRRPAGIDVKAAGAQVEALAPRHDVKSWRQLMPTLASLMQSSEAMVRVMFFIVYIAIGIVILNAMLMAVFERIREFGVLKAVGMGPLMVMRLILAESLILIAIALLIGVSASIPMLIYLRDVGLNMGGMEGLDVAGIGFDPIWRAVISKATFSAPVASFVVVVLLAVLYPAAKAARLRPVDAIRYR